MSITRALANANTGLAAAQRRADLVANNIANALTPGYSRREISLSERVTGGVGGGVAVDGVRRAGDPVLTRERRIAEGFSQRDQTIASAYQALNQALGEPEDAFSLFSQFQNLESAFRALGETPESASQQALTLDAAKALASTLNQLSAKTQQIRQDADGAIARSVDFVNTALKEIEKLNRDIAAAAGSGRDVAALEDQRKGLVDEVARIIPVREVPRERGAIDLITNEGVFLIAGTAKQISFTQAGVITPTSAYNAGAGTLSGLSVGGVDITPGTGSQSLRQGALAGQFAVRDTVGTEFQAQLDALARDLLERTAGVDGTVGPGAAGLFTDAGAAFDPLTEQGLSARIAINAAVDPASGGALFRLRDGIGAATEGVAGDATLVRSILDRLTESRTLPPGAAVNGAHSAASGAAGVLSSIGAARVAAESNLASSSARADAVIDAEAAATGVDTDAELQSLILIEQAFAANARVIQTAQSMIETLIGL